MAIWGKDKKPQPEAAAPAATPQEIAAQVEENTASALPRKSTYFDSLRTDAYMNHNVVENFVEFWVAMKVDKENDKWRIMHYMIYDLDKKDGKLNSEVATKQDVDFVEAVRQLAKYERIADNLQTHADVNLEQTYPPAQYPELKVYFYDIEPYKRAANIEGLAFDSQNAVYRRVEGKVTANATFKRSEIVSSILAIDGAGDVPALQAKIEGGILSDIFATASDRAATLDNILKIGQVLNTMDDFALQVGAFYLAIQGAVGRTDKFDTIGGLQPDEKTDILSRSSALSGVKANDPKAFQKILNDIIPAMNQSLETAKSAGVHVEPFQKFASECEFYANLLYASKNLSKLEKGFVGVNNTDTSLLTEIRQSVDRAQKKFAELGGSQEQMDKVKAWVANPRKDEIPGWLPNFLTRYYESRGKVMQKVQARAAGLTQVETMSVDVKPPVADEFNDTSAKPANNNAAAPVEKATVPSSRPRNPGASS